MRTPPCKTLVAGIGNIFFGDDAFGVEVAGRLSRGGHLPAGTTVMDVGIRAVHLSFELMNDYDAVILVDAARRGLAPGTLTVIVPDVDDAIRGAREARLAGDAPLMDAHGMGPVDVLTVLGDVESHVDVVRLLACEPASVEEGIGLSPAVEAVIDRACDEVRSLVDELATLTGTC